MSFQTNTLAFLADFSGTDMGHDSFGTFDEGLLPTYYAFVGGMILANALGNLLLIAVSSSRPKSTSLHHYTLDWLQGQIHL